MFQLKRPMMVDTLPIEVNGRALEDFPTGVRSRPRP